MKNNLQPIAERIRTKPDFRRALASSSLSWFFTIYFPHYITCKAAVFHQEMLGLLEDEDISKVVITAFRGSAKSTLATLALPIWSILGNQNRKYVLVISQTQHLAKQILTNIKQELSENKLLQEDFGPFEEIADEWRANSLVLSGINTRISAISQSESIRGLRHLQYRPDLIVVDDVEDLESVKTRESRDKLWNWLTGEVIPTGDIGTKLIVIGNLLHEDSLMMRLKEHIELGRMEGIYREYPLIDENGEITWPGKYPDMAAIEKKRKEVADDVAWYREYLLKFIPDDRRIVQREWPQYWTNLPDQEREAVWLAGIGTDLAISQKSTADYTALIPFVVTGMGNDLKIYILPYLVNKRINFTDTITEIKKLREYLQTDFDAEPKVLVEHVGYQAAVAQQLKAEYVQADTVSISGHNKRSRLEVATPYIRLGKVLFPQKGAEQLISQIVNFGIEKYDDLADAFTLIVLKVLELDRPSSSVGWSKEDHKPHYERDPIFGCLRDTSKPITAGLLDKQF